MAKKYIMGQQAQARRRSVRYVAVISALLLLAAVLQVSVFGRYRIFGIIPDLMITTVLCLGFFTGPYVGAVSGIGAGFLIDALGASGLSLMPICYFLSGYVTGFYAKSTGKKGIGTYAIYLSLTVLYRAAVTVLMACLSYGELHLLMLLWQVVLPELLATALVGLALYYPLRALCTWVETKL